jgi:hypothetical protein
MTRYFLIVMFLYMLIIPTFSCEKESSANTTWFRDPNGQFHTNDLKRAQKETPFKIIMPSYWPTDLNTDQIMIVGPIKINDSKSTQIEISYVNNNTWIYINEENDHIVMSPTEQLSPVYHNISGISVLQEKIIYTTGSGTIEGIAFYWNQNELTFSLETKSYRQEEGIKIVESMINRVK